MILRLLFLACVIQAAMGPYSTLRAAPAGGIEISPPATGNMGAQDTVARCQKPGQDPSMVGTPLPSDLLTAGAPPALEITPLAVARAEHLQSPPGHLSLARLEYGPNTGTATRKASGPLLFVVESGTIDIFRTGVRVRLGPGASALIQLDQRYAFVNDSSAPASLLRLSLTPLDGTDEPVLDFKDVTPTPGPALAPPNRTWLFRGELRMFPPEPVELFMACMVWKSTSDIDSMYRHSGPVGLKLLEGTLSVGKKLTLATGGCALFEPHANYLVQTTVGPSHGMLFGVFPMGQSLWLPATERTADAPELGFGVSCGDAP